MTELLPLPAQGLPARVVTHVGDDLELADAPLRPELLEGIAENTAHASAAGTRRAYEGDWAPFERWCDVHGRHALPAQPQTVAGSITDRAALVEPGAGDHVYAPPRSQGGSPPRRMALLLLNDLEQGFRDVDLHSYPACRADCSRLPEFGTVQRMDPPASALTATLPGTLVI